MYSTPGDWNNTLKVINQLIERSRRQESSRSKSSENQPTSPEPLPDLILLSREQLDTWIETQTDRSSFPIFQLALEERPFPKMNEAFYGGRVALKRLHSGAFEMNATTPEEANFLPFRDRFLQDALQVATETSYRGSSFPGDLRYRSKILSAAARNRFSHLAVEASVAPFVRIVRRRDCLRDLPESPPWPCYKLV